VNEFQLGRRHCSRFDGWILVCTETGAVAAPSCGRIRSCAPCGARRAGRIADAFIDSVPQRMHLFTGASEPGTTRRALNRVIDLIRTADPSSRKLQLANVVEPNPRGTGHHVHALSHGGTLPCDSGLCSCDPVEGPPHAVWLGGLKWCSYLTPLAGRRGWGRVSTGPLINLEGGVIYCLKRVRSVLFLPTETGDAVYASHLRANHGRLAGWTRRFLRTPDGADLPGIHAAIEGARIRRGYGSTGGSWRLVRTRRSGDAA
jgi:hypothetical protein